MDTVDAAIHDTNATTHRAYDRLGAIENRLGELQSEVAALKDHRNSEMVRWQEVNGKLDKLGADSSNALKTLSEWATIRKTLAWVAGLFWTVSLVLGGLFGWFYSQFWHGR